LAVGFSLQAARLSTTFQTNPEKTKPFERNSVKPFVLKKENEAPYTTLRGNQPVHIHPSSSQGEEGRTLASRPD